VTVECDDPVWLHDDPVEPCTAEISGPGPFPAALTISYDGNDTYGIATATATYPGDDNHFAASATATFQVNQISRSGFYKPVDMDKRNVVKGGSTVPLKFEVVLNGVEQTDTAVVESVTMTPASCTTGGAIGAAQEIGNTGGTALRYDVKAGQFVQNWQTPKSAGACYTVTMTTVDGGSISADFQLK
jgi:hypothetical protein